MPPARREELVALYKEVSACTKCPLYETRTKAVFGAGNADADLMFVGEAPGAEEDRQGLPFVGRAGQLLNQMLEEIGLSREDVFICNVLKSRPPNNRDPQPGEIAACEPYLWEQVRLIEPRVVCTLGNFATKLLTGSPTGITRVRGTPQVHELGGRTVRLLPLFHPAAALRTPAVKEQLRADFATIPALIEEALPAPLPSAAEIAEAEAREEIAAEPPPADQLGFFGEPERRWRGAHRNPLGDGDRSGRRRARRPARARRRGRRLRRGRGGEDDADPGRRPGPRRDRTGHLADLHDRPALHRRPAADLPSRSLPAGGHRGRGSGAARRLPRRPTASPSSSGPRRGPGASAAPRSRCGSNTQARSAAGSRSSVDRAAAVATAADSPPERVS